MRKGRTSIAVSAVIIILYTLSFVAGSKWALRDTVSYTVNGTRIIFRSDRWDDGLGLLKLQSALVKLREASTNDAVDWLEACLDLSVRGAMQRRPLLSPQNQMQMDGVLTVVADYRREYPRPIDEVGEEPNVVEARKEVDAFLESFETRQDGNGQ